MGPLVAVEVVTVRSPSLPSPNSVFMSMESSRGTMARIAGVPEDPSAGEAKNLLPLCAAHVAVSVPVPVTGDPLTENSAGRLSPTLLTPPPPAIWVHTRLVTPRFTESFVQTNALSALDVPSRTSTATPRSSADASASAARAGAPLAATT